MNTRSKIISAPIDGPAVLVIGTFDPLLAAHSARLAELASTEGSALVVAVSDDGVMLLERRARMELVAALRMVDFVMPYQQGLETAFSWTSVYDDRALHGRWNVEFKEHVRRRSQPA